MTRDNGNDEAGAEAEGPETPQADGPAPAADATPSGSEAAVDALRGAFGDDVVTLWRTGGPRKSHTDEVSCVLVEIGGVPTRLVVQSFESGAFKLFAPVAGKTPEQMVEALSGMYDA